MSISIDRIILLSPPFVFGGEDTGSDTSVFNEIVLETPIVKITGTYYNPETGSLEDYSQSAIQHETLQSGSSFTSPVLKTFIGPITISFSSRYPLKTYPTITRASNQFIGEPTFGYQSNRAEIRYSLTGRDVHLKSSTYKRDFILKHNTAGSDNVLLNYKIFYKGKTSPTGSIYINIDKTDDKFYSFDENG